MKIKSIDNIRTIKEKDEQNIQLKFQRIWRKVKKEFHNHKIFSDDITKLFSGKRKNQ